MTPNRVDLGPSVKLVLWILAVPSIPLTIGLALTEPLAFVRVVLVVLAIPFLFFGGVHGFLFLARRVAVRADNAFARRRFNLPRSARDPYCVLFRSTRADESLTIDMDDHWQTVRDPGFLRVDVAPGFRGLLSHRMQPFYTVMIKNSTYVADLVGVTYSDNEWQARVLQDMEDAAFILLLPFWPSEALDWELSRLVERGLLGKTFIVMPPAYLFRPPAAVYVSTSVRLFDRTRYVLHETLRMVAPLYFQRSRYKVSFESEREAEARTGWSAAQDTCAAHGLRLPEYESQGAFYLAECLTQPPSDMSLAEADARRVAEVVGILDWREDTTGTLLASIARSRRLPQ